MEPFRFEPYDNSRATGTIAELMLRGPDARARALELAAQARARASEIGGQGWSNAIQGIGQSVAGTIGDVIKQRDEAPFRQQALTEGAQRVQLGQQQLQENQQKITAGQKAAAVQAVLPKIIAAHTDGSGTVDHQGVVSDLMQIDQPTASAYDDMWTKHATNAAQLTKIDDERANAQADFVGNVLGSAKTPDDFHAALAIIATAKLDPAVKSRVLQDADQAGPDAWQQVAKHYQLASPSFQKSQAATDAENRKPMPIGPHGIGSVEGGVLVPPTPLQTKPEEPPKVGTFEDYTIRYAAEKGKPPASLTPSDIEDARKRYQQADDRPRVSVTVPGAAGLSDDAVNYTATQYRVLGPSGIPTRIEAPDRVKILNEAASQAKALGQTPAQAVQKQAAFKSDAGSLTQMRKMSSSAESFETKALGQADIIADLSKKVGRTKFPFINRALLAGKSEIAGDADTQQLFNALSTFTAEYAKIMEGSTGSAAASSDSSRKAADRLIAAYMNQGTITKTLDLMKREMRLTLQGYDATIEHITNRMGGGAVPDASGTTKTPIGRFNPATGKVEPIN